jgi:glycine dehydrogenase
MQSTPAVPLLHPLAALENPAEFVARHVGIAADDEARMLSAIGAASREALVEAIVPRSIARSAPMDLPAPLGEAAALAELKVIAGRNRVLRSFIGQGYHGTHTPGVILRNVLENPAWYTAYTPYQAEISQGRMEALVNFQTLVCDLTGMAIANASMLDEATAAAEAMTLALRMGKSKSTTFFVADDVLPQTLAVVRTRARPLGLSIVTGPADSAAAHDAFAALLQYPGVDGAVHDLRPVIGALHARGAQAIVAADPLALALLVPPGEMGADIAVGTCAPPTWPHATTSSARCRAGWWASASTRTARRPTAWRCRRANSTSAARRPRRTSAPPRCCRRWWQACTPSTTGPRA